MAATEKTMKLLLAELKAIVKELKEPKQAGENRPK